MQEAVVYVARQPIFDRNLHVFGYELLFRSSFLNSYTGKDGDAATRDIIANSFLMFGIEALTHGKRAFINFTTDSVLKHIPLILPPGLLVVELLEDISPTGDILAACRKLKQEKYLIAMDDFSLKPGYEPLILLADILKIDFRATPPAERASLPATLRDKKYQGKFLAEKVETREEFEAAMAMGYSYFQGYFFSKPAVMSARKLPGYQVNYLRILQEINRPDLAFEQIEDILRRDVSLTFKLLKFINSAVFGFRGKISSVRHALTLIGPKELAKWVSLLALQGMGEHKPGELIVNSLIRARFAEALAAQLPQIETGNAFLMGMFSHIDALLDRPLDVVLAEIPLEKEIQQALLGAERNSLFLLYQLVQTYEKGDWPVTAGYAGELSLTDTCVAKAYRDALLWVHDLLVHL